MSKERLARDQFTISYVNWFALTKCQTSQQCSIKTRTVNANVVYHYGRHGQSCDCQSEEGQDYKSKDGEVKERWDQVEPEYL
jgi:hypothetical protein